MFKYPKTYHLTWSPGVTHDDKIISSLDNFIGKRVIVTEKLDGECTTITKGNIHARSMDSKDHVSRHWVKSQYGYLTYALREPIKICGENVFAKHSIAYDNLIGFFYAFSLWDGTKCLSWDDTLAELAFLNIPHVPVIYDGLWDESYIRHIPLLNTEKGIMEGYVVRLADEFELIEFSNSVAKYVRPNHVQTDEHWLYQPIIKNKLIGD